MGLLEKISAERRGLKTFTPQPNFWDVDNLMFPFLGSSSWSSERETIETDFTGFIEGIYKRNGPIFALMAARASIFSEARFMFRRIRGGRPGDLFGTPALDLLHRPWPNATTGDLLARMLQDADLAGNSYWTKVGGRLRRLRPDWVTIITGSHREPDLYGAAIDAEIVAYMYEPRGQGAQGATILLPNQVAHFAPEPDPDANWRGMSWLTPVIQEVSADAAATLHKKMFFENGASPQLVVKVDPALDVEKFKRFKAAMDDQHKGAHNAYKTLYIGGGADVTTTGMDLRQLDFKATQGAGETRLAAAARVPVAIAGFSEGLQGSPLNSSNFSAARRLFADGTLRPLWRNVAGSLSTLIDVPSDAELWYDERDIAFLREDAADQAAILKEQMLAIESGVRSGFTPETVMAAVVSGDLTLMTHTGLFSVQLQPPMTTTPAAAAPAAIDPPTGDQNGQ